MPREQSERLKTAATPVVPPLLAVPSNVAEDEFAINLITHEVKFSERSRIARCDRMKLTSYGVIVTQMPMEVDESLIGVESLFISYREITKLQLSQSPTLDSNYMIITVGQRIAKTMFDKFLGFGTFHPSK